MVIFYYYVLHIDSWGTDPLGLMLF